MSPSTSTIGAAPVGRCRGACPCVYGHPDASSQEGRGVQKFRRAAPPTLHPSQLCPFPVFARRLPRAGFFAQGRARSARGEGPVAGGAVGVVVDR